MDSLINIEGGLSARQSARVGAMTQAGQHLLEMIERVLDFASIESGRMELYPARVSVRDLGEKCVAFIEPISAERALSLRMVVSRDAPEQITADPSRLRQVILNLVGNAVKYTDTGGVELRMLAGTKPGGLRVEVADTGPGIHEGNVVNLFKDFERLGAATSVEGAGLGLAIAARIVRVMNGTIGCTANPAGGTVFWLELPNADVAASPSLLNPCPPAMPPSSRRVLLVDDIAMNRDVIGAFLLAAGQEVVLAENGHDAVRLAFEQTFDVILMDVRMPGMDGLEATRRIRALPAPRGRVPILALTAYTFQDQVAQCRIAGMDGYVAKPVDYATLMNAIAGAITRAPPAWAEECPAPAQTEPEERPASRFDRAILEQLLAFLPPDEIALNLRTLRSRKEQMLQLLDQQATPAAMAETAHALASAAGMFGFTALSVIAARFERAVAYELIDAEFVGQRLRKETFAALAKLDGLMHEFRMQPA